MDKTTMQREWDDELVKSFYLRPDVAMYNMSTSFKQRFGEYPNVAGILRVPSFAWQGRLTVSRFVVACLPKIARVLWKHTIKDAEKIISVLARSKIDVQNESKEFADTRRERTMFDKSAKDYAIQRMQFAIYKDAISLKNETLRGKGIKSGRLR